MRLPTARCSRLLETPIARVLSRCVVQAHVSYARRTRDHDKVRAHVAVLSGGVDEAWKLSMNRRPVSINSRVAAITVAAEPQDLSNAEPVDPVAEGDDLHEDDMSSNAL